MARQRTIRPRPGGKVTGMSFRRLMLGSLFIGSILAVYASTLKGLSSREASIANEFAESLFLRPAATTPPSLESLSSSSGTTTCARGLQLLSNKLHKATSLQSNRKIPRIIHQTSKSRCVTKKVAHAADQWRNSTGFSYFLHDDKAVRRLFNQFFPEFPHLKLVADTCIVHGTLAADLWRYLILWQNGGIYADLDAVPAKFDPETSIDSDDDAFFVVEQYHLLSQWFMAVSPRHPIMFYAVHHSLANLLKAVDTGTIPAPLYTGPHALHSAYRDFRRDAGDYVDTAVPGNKPVMAGRFTGTHNRTVTVVGVASNQNEIVNRDVLKTSKLREYAKMGMRHFQEDKKIATGTSCLHSIFVNSILGS